MTREEAIEILKSNKPTSDPRKCGKELCAAVDIAIEALQEPELDIEIIYLLLSKCLELFKLQEESPYVLNLLEQTVYYDDVECDGFCLMEDIENVFEDMRGEEE